jgi:hypothetical protein
MFAAIRPSHPTGTASSTIDIRVDRATVADLYAKLVCWYFEHGPRKFVTQHARVNVGRVAARECMEVRSADSDSPNGKERLSLDRGGLWDVAVKEDPGFSQNNLSHVASDWINQ